MLRRLALSLGFCAVGLVLLLATPSIAQPNIVDEVPAGAHLQPEAGEIQPVAYDVIIVPRSSGARSSEIGRTRMLTSQGWVTLPGPAPRPPRDLRQPRDRRPQAQWSGGQARWQQSWQPRWSRLGDAGRDYGPPQYAARNDRLQAQRSLPEKYYSDRPGAAQYGSARYGADWYGRHRW